MVANNKSMDGNGKITATKKSMIHHMIKNGTSTLAEMARDLDLSVPTVTKFASELIEDNYILDLGKQNAASGRRPSVFGLNPKAGYFVGVDVQQKKILLTIMDFGGHMIGEPYSVSYRLEDTSRALNQLFTIIKDYINMTGIKREDTFCAGVNIAGRVNPITGYSYSYFQYDKRPLAQTMKEEIGIPVFLDNDSRSMAYGEYVMGDYKRMKNVLFVNLNWGLGAGIIIDGHPYYGKSGFSGEIGHICALDNEIICNCGKKGCLETEVSGFAVERLLKEKCAQGSSTIMSDLMREHGEFLLSDFIEAVRRGDVLSIEIIENIGFTLGRWLAGLINVLNPELVIVGGPLAETKEYLSYPMQSSIRKYSLNFVNSDTKVQMSQFGENASLMGACLIARSRMLELI